jgi:methylenetetrahydrofolate dehydrogenase (NADP+)/methenyltetrahydrofolate cyclohydrolase
MAELIDGKAIAASYEAKLKDEVFKLTEAGKQAGLVVVLLGDNAASQTYVAAKSKACQRVGIYSETIRKPAATTEDELLSLIDELNENPVFDGILVQLPLPKHISEGRVLSRISPNKDVDCFHPENVGKLVSGEGTLRPCTPAGMIEMLKTLPINTSGKHAVVLGRSNIVGKPIANMLLQSAENANCTVTICHSRTENLEDHIRRADILVAAIGKPEFVRGDMLKDGVVVLDVGINRIAADNEKAYKIVGDVHFDEASQKASYITPVPGGVGKMTIVMLLKNTLECAKLALK